MNKIVYIYIYIYIYAQSQRTDTVAASSLMYMYTCILYDNIIYIMTVNLTGAVSCSPDRCNNYVYMAGIDSPRKALRPYNTIITLETRRRRHPIAFEETDESFNLRWKHCESPKARHVL